MDQGEYAMVSNKNKTSKGAGATAEAVAAVGGVIAGGIVDCGIYQLFERWVSGKVAQA
ncbi:MAG: hypothetical protein J7M14_00985 [Planctomycetes bacterium]|nr:hypothetical protein [Planctomycetota bacterium]